MDSLLKMGIDFIFVISTKQDYFLNSENVALTLFELKKNLVIIKTKYDYKGDSEVELSIPGKFSDLICRNMFGSHFSSFFTSSRFKFSRLDIRSKDRHNNFENCRVEYMDLASNLEKFKPQTVETIFSSERATLYVYKTSLVRTFRIYSRTPFKVVGMLLVTRPTG